MRFMFCRVTDMHNKEVINVHDGRRLGCVDDVEVDTCTAQLVSIVIHGRPKWGYWDTKRISSSAGRKSR